MNLGAREDTHRIQIISNRLIAFLEEFEVYTGV